VNVNAKERERERGKRRERRRRRKTANAVKKRSSLNCSESRKMGIVTFEPSLFINYIPKSTSVNSGNSFPKSAKFVT
jgi:hypothetical protein